ncbi:MAG: N-acetylmuramoyl-L-alanine amidase [Caldicoprobacterales bacterium]|jgi:N-acetylmuramoyl-L-alanine amidase|nr:N-acetylmuramoyl-L-alanine amidase [Clostridiales bacterium]
MKLLYFSKAKLLLLWVSVGMLLLLFTVDYNKVSENVCAFSSPVSQKVIVIDPGHGGFDSGAVSPSGTREDELNLKVAKKLKQYLTNHNANVILTRTTNEALASRKSEDMRKRVEIIRANNPDLVISIHMNKFSQTQYFGGQTFYLSGSEKGKKLAECIQTQILENLIEGNTRQIKGVDNLLILKASKAPTVLVECGFLSNLKEEDLLKTEEYQDKIAWSIFNGILSFLTNENEPRWEDGLPSAFLN